MQNKLPRVFEFSRTQIDFLDNEISIALKSICSTDGVRKTMVKITG